MAKIEVYIADYCPYCKSAKQLLDSKGVSYEEIDVTHDADKRRWLMEASGQRTVPQIFINDESCGGFSDIAALDRTGELDKLLTAE